jgi:hypothetical protein
MRWTVGWSVAVVYVGFCLVVLMAVNRRGRRRLEAIRRSAYSAGWRDAHDQMRTYATQVAAGIIRTDDSAPVAPEDAGPPE